MRVRYRVDGVLVESERLPKSVQLARREPSRTRRTTLSPWAVGRVETRMSTSWPRSGACIRRPNGLVLVTGPTGSGKTTTLYAALRRINGPHLKVVRYGRSRRRGSRRPSPRPGPGAGSSGARPRSRGRCPDDSAPATVTRLMDMGIEPYLIAATLNGVVAQRLVRRLCGHDLGRDHPAAIAGAVAGRAAAGALEAQRGLVREP
jgi:general secretion pathway protein E